MNDASKVITTRSEVNTDEFTQAWEFFRRHYGIDLKNVLPEIMILLVDVFRSDAENAIKNLTDKIARSQGLDI
jgi:hypothetical protein